MLQIIDNQRVEYFYLRACNRTILELKLKYGVGNVLSFSDTYQYWLPDSLPANFETLIYVNDELGDDMPGFFHKIEKVWELDMPLSRQHGNQVYLLVKGRRRRFLGG